MTVRDSLVRKIWAGKDPFEGYPARLYRPDPQGWNHDHPYFADAIASLRPGVVVEVGVWKGASSIGMAHALKAQGTDAVVLCVDTWLGAADHWTNPDWFDSLAVEYGQPMLMRTFMANVVMANVQDVILPMPLDSVNAAEVLKFYGITVDLVHIDAGHEYGSVISDLSAWWPMLRAKGVLLGDDYYTGGEWPGLRRAYDEFFGALGLTAPLENTRAKCRVIKD